MSYARSPLPVCSTTMGMSGVRHMELWWMDLLCVSVKEPIRNTCSPLMWTSGQLEAQSKDCSGPRSDVHTGTLSYVAVCVYCAMVC